MERKEFLLRRMFTGAFREEESRDEARVKALIDRVCKASVIGKQLVESALKNGVEICMSDEIDAIGSYNHESKLIKLNKFKNDDTLVSTLVHECRHAEQTTRLGPSKYSTFTSVGVVRANEADAMAHQTAAAYQMRRTDVAAFIAFSNVHPNVMWAYQSEMDESKDMNKALGEAFKAWYDDSKYVAKYDDKTLMYLSFGSVSPKAYKTTLSGRELAETVCMKDGKTYVEPEFFVSERATTVTEFQASKAAKIEANHYRNFFRFGEVPTSADMFYIRKSSGIVDTPKTKAPLLPAAVLKRGMDIKGR